MATSGQKQHVEIYRKIMLRRRLMKAVPPGAAFVPFIGDGDIAAELYHDRVIWGADLDAERVAKANNRLPGNNIIVGDCDGWPFPPEQTPPTFAIADFDAYCNPYKGIDAFLQHATLTHPACIIGTDGMKQDISRNKLEYGDLIKPSKPSEKEWRRQYNMWFPKYVLPWLTARLDKYVIRRKMFYQRGKMIYWGLLIEHKAIQV